MQKITCVLALTFLTGLIACDNDISSASQLRRVRLLAVQAEPPNPAFGESTRLRPLVYLPPGESVTYEWSWCPVPTSSADGYRCPVDQAAVDNLAVLAGLTGLPPLFLGTTETIEFTNPFPPSLLASLCKGDSAAIRLFLGNASEGKTHQDYTCTLATLPVQVMLTIRGSITDTGVLPLYLPIDETTPGNQNPVITNVSVISPEPVRILDDTGLTTVPRDRKVKLHAGVDITQAEVYLDRLVEKDGAFLKDSAGQNLVGPTRERLTLLWFSEGGGFIERRIGWSARDLDENGQPLSLNVAIENEWITPKVDDYAASSSMVLVIVYDSRGGVSWTSGGATLEVLP
jgi:hypothetical protein